MEIFIIVLYFITSISYIIGNIDLLYITSIASVLLSITYSDFYIEEQYKIMVEYDTQYQDLIYYFIFAMYFVFILFIILRDSPRKLFPIQNMYPYKSVVNPNTVGYYPHKGYYSV